METTLKNKLENVKNRKIIMTVLLAVYWIGIFVLTHIPIPQVVYEAKVSDKTLHFVAYLIFTFLLCSAVSPNKKINWRKKTIWWLVLVMVAYAVIDEWLQQYIGRSTDLTDFFANMKGVATGLILLSFLEFKSCFIIVTGTSILCISTLAKENLGQLMPKLYSTFHLFGYSLFTQLWIWKLRQYRNKINLTQLKWIIIAYAFPLGFLTTVILTAKITDRYFELINMIIAFAAISATVIANAVALKLSNKQAAKANAKKY